MRRCAPAQQGYICVDDITVEGQDGIFDHAVRRASMQRRLSDTDVTVLSMLRNINDGVIVVDDAGHIIEHQPGSADHPRPRAAHAAGPDLGTDLLLYRRER